MFKSTRRLMLMSVVASIASATFATAGETELEAAYQKIVKDRADTLALSFQSAASLLIVVAAILLAFQEAGVDIKTVLGGAAIMGVACTFGAQNLMRDYFTGFMIVLEDQYQLGDLITVDNITGRVEKATCAPGYCANWKGVCTSSPTVKSNRSPTGLTFGAALFWTYQSASRRMSIMSCA